MKPILLLLALVMLTGCPSLLVIKPKPVVTEVVPYSGADQNNGVLSQDSTGILITAGKRDEYNALIAIYGSARWVTGLPCFVPALKPDFGITAVPPNYHLNNEGVQQLALMKSWLKQGKAPK